MRLRPSAQALYKCVHMIQKQNFVHIFQNFNIFSQKPKETDLTEKAHTLNKYIITKHYLFLQDCKTYAWQFKLMHELYNS